jgi:hypothetical protein
MSARTGCHRYFNGLCAHCEFCRALWAKPVEALTPEEWIEIRKRGRYVNGLRPDLRLVPAQREAKP